MRVVRKGVALPGIENVEVEGAGSYNFSNGEADFPDAIARMLCDRDVCTPMEGTRVQVPMGTRAVGDLAGRGDHVVIGDPKK
jgi:hypothetical protein